LLTSWIKAHDIKVRSQDLTKQIACTTSDQIDTTPTRSSRIEENRPTIEWG